MSTRCREVKCEVLTVVLLKFLALRNACWAGEVQHQVFHTAQLLCSLFLAPVSFVFMYTKSLHAATLYTIFFDVLLTVHLSIFISVINQLDAQNFCFKISLFHASTCFEHRVLIIRRSKFHYKASGIITLKQVSGLKLLKHSSINMSK